METLKPWPPGGRQQVSKSKAGRWARYTCTAPQHREYGLGVGDVVPPDRIMSVPCAVLAWVCDLGRMGKYLNY